MKTQIQPIFQADEDAIEAFLSYLERRLMFHRAQETTELWYLVRRLRAGRSPATLQRQLAEARLSEALQLQEEPALPSDVGLLLDLVNIGELARQRVKDAWHIARRGLPPQPWRPWEEWSTEDLLRVQSLDASCGALAEYTRRLPPGPPPRRPKPLKPLPAPPKPPRQPKPRANKDVERMLASLRPVLLSSGERHDDRVWLRERWVPYLARRQRLLRQVAERIVIDLPDEVYWSFPLACLGGTE